jgi:quinoprotein glucose dehydrogenase
MAQAGQVLSIGAGAVLVITCAFAEGPGRLAHGGDAGGTRYSAAAQITPANINRPAVAWTYSTRDLETKGQAMRRTSFEDTPILAEARLYVCSPFNEVSARSRNGQGDLAFRSRNGHRHSLPK